MLHFPYDDHFNDISCNHAISILYGDKHGAIIQKDGNNKYVCFSGKTHFEVCYIYIYLYIYIYVYVYACVCMYICLCVCMCIY